ncbi:DUF6304 family protein [Streptomyces sp. SID8016]|uniref:DUF6304 family protein n=1 Tax=Streptomyces sp. SID8016 TaxID=2706098 RepID=UPI0013DABDF9|nr:hypothetical protein [Streptomyces sp. SID8016]
MTDESWSGWYRDARGSEAVVLTTDGQRLRVRVRGTDFEGDSFDALYPVVDSAPRSAGAGRAGAPLTDCVLEWDLPLPVLVAGTLRHATLGCLLSLRPDVPALHLALHIGGAVYESARAEGDFSAALATVRRALPDDIRLQTCSDCAFSGSFPAPGRALSGTLACFRGAKDAYRGAAAGEGGVPDLWDRRSGTVQEIWSCREFEASATEGTDADRREAVPLEHA